MLFYVQFLLLFLSECCALHSNENSCVVVALAKFLVSEKPAFVEHVNVAFAMRTKFSPVLVQHVTFVLVHYGVCRRKTVSKVMQVSAERVRTDDGYLAVNRWRIEQM